MLNLVLADAELELVSQELISHPSVWKSAERRKKKPTSILLDSSLHHQALRRLADGSRRGRPDITHFFLLLALDSIANSRGLLRVWVHTRNNEVIHIAPETRIPRAASRFFGLIEAVFAQGAVPDKTHPLIWVEDSSLGDLLKNVGGKKVCLDPEGEHRSLDGLIGTDEDITFIIGGFAEGDFLSPVGELVGDRISISPDLLKVWTVTSEIIVSFEKSNGLI